MIQRSSLRSASAVGLGMVSCAVSSLGCEAEGSYHPRLRLAFCGLDLRWLC